MPQERLTTHVYGPDGQERAAGEAPAPEWAHKRHEAFMQMLRDADAIESGKPQPRPAEHDVAHVELSAHTRRSRRGGRPDGGGR